MNSPAPPTTPIFSKGARNRSRPAGPSTISRARRLAGRQRRVRSRSPTATAQIPPFPRPTHKRAGPTGDRGGGQGPPARLRRADVSDAGPSLRRRATDGCMKSSSTAIGFRRISKTERSGSGPVAGSTGRKSSATAFGQALRSLPARTALIDGELVVENESGVSEFSLLQADLSDGRADRFVYYAFDCLYLDGYDLRETPLIRAQGASQPADRNAAAAQSATAPISSRTASSCCSAPARSVSKALSRRPANPSTSRAAARAGSSANVPPGRSLSSPATSPRPQVARRSARWRSASTRARPALCRPRRDRFFVRGRRGVVHAARRNAHPLESIRQTPHHGRSASSPLRSARADRRGRFPGLDRRRPPAPGVLSGLAR